MQYQYTLIGYPLGHSMSPWIHERLSRLSDRADTYTLTEIAPGTLEQAIGMLKQQNGFNITIPYKTEILPYLDSLDETAERYAAVNCVAVRPDGSLHGYNTDCTGFLRSVQDMSLGGKVLLVGCGGVGRMMATEAVRHGADLSIAEPDREKAEALVQTLHRQYPEATVTLTDAEALAAGDATFDLLMNASPVGMYPRTDACPVSDSVIQRSAAVFDVIYNPTETLLMQKARAMGKRAVGGSAMLVWQAVQAHEIWNQEVYKPEAIQKLIAEMEEEICRLFPGK